jgi:hypothetical protein
MARDRWGLIKTPTNDGRCEAEASDIGGWHNHRCRNASTVERKGVHYCLVHDPIKKAAKDKIREEKWQEQQKISEYKWYANAYCKKQNISLETLKKIVGD